MKGVVPGITVVEPQGSTFKVLSHEASNGAMLAAGYHWDGEHWTTPVSEVDTRDAGKCRTVSETSSYCGDWLLIVDGLHPYERRSRV